MAEIVQSLFGVSPESYQQAQQQRADAQALQYAQLTPFQQANYAIGRGANMLGGAIGGALGGQDPELQRITARQQIARQIDLTNPESIQQGMAMLRQAGDTVGLQQLAQIFRQQQESGALIGQRNAAAQASIAQATRERGPTGDVAKAMRVGEITRALQTPELNPLERSGLEAELSSLSPTKAKEPTTNEITNAAAFAATKGDPGTPAYTAAFQSKFNELIAPKEPKGPSFGTDREAVAAEVYDKAFALLSPTERAVVNKRVEDEQNRKAKATAATLVLPGDKALVDIPAFRAKVQSTIDPQLKAVNAADQALEAIETSLATGNFVSFNAARVQLAKALGDSQLSKRDVEQAGGDPSLLGGFADLTSKLFTSTPTVDTQNKIKQTLEAIRKVAARKATTEVEQQRKIALRSPGYDAGAVTEALTFSELTPRATSGGGTLAEQAAAELKRRQSKGK
jgi:hypothetical protein